MGDGGRWEAYGRDLRSGIGDEAARSLEDQIAVHEELGWRSMELRTVERRPLAELGSGELDTVVGMLLDAGFDVPVLDSAIGNWGRSVTAPFDEDVAELRTLAEVARRLATPFIRIMSYPKGGVDDETWRRIATERVAALAQIAEDEGVTLVHENCVGWAGRSAERTLDLLEAADSPALRVLFDVGNPVVDGYDGHAYLERVLPAVVAIHAKDATVGAAGEPQFTMPGAGDGRLGDCLKLAFASGYRGHVAIEPHVAHVIHLGADAPPAVLRRSYVTYARRFEELVEAALEQAGLLPVARTGRG